MNERLKLTLSMIGLTLLTLIAYATAIQGGFIWDDPRYVTDNELLRTPGGLAQIWFDLGATIQYYPMVFTTFWVEYQLWDLDPTGYHLINVLLHAGNALLLFLLLRRLDVPLPWLCAAVFALHPIHVESVAWITERKNVLSGFFYLAAALAYLRFALPPINQNPTDRSRRRWYLVALILFGMAMLSKTVAASWPAAMLLVLWWKRGQINRHLLLSVVPFFIVGIALGSITIYLEKTNVGAEGAAWDLSFTQRILIAGRALWFYLGKLLVPLHLTFSYPRWHVNPAALSQWMFPILAAALPLTLWFLRNKLGRGPLVAVLFYGGTLVPALGFVDVYPMRYSFVADHFVYLASIGLIVLLVPAVGWLVRRAASEGDGWSGWQRTTAGATLVILTGLTWWQGRIYTDLETLWRDTLAKNPNAFLAHNNLGSLLTDRGENSAAREHFERAIQLDPTFHEAHYNLGRLLLDENQLEPAIEQFQRALTFKPDLAAARTSLGIALRRLGRTDDAIRELEAAVESDADYRAARLNLANALATAGEFEPAIGHYRKLLQQDANDADVRGNLANALAESGQIDAALAQFDQALKARPENAGLRRAQAVTLVRAGRVRAAIGAYSQLMQLTPGDVQSRFVLAGLLRQAGMLDEAIREYQEVLHLAPQHEEAARALEETLRARGR